MKTLALLLSSSLLAINVSAQVTWADDAAEVFYNNCTSCHNPNGIGPNSLMTYSEAATYGSLIQTYVTNNIMPPWTADSSYQHYSQERILTQQERDILLDWVSDGMLSGDLMQAPPAPVYNGNQILPGVPDLVVTAPNYMSKATTSDDYVCFAVPSGLTENRKIKAIEVIPGNTQTVHHCIVYHDNTGSATTDTIGGDCAGPIFSDMLMGYTPGSTPVIFPANNDFASGIQMQAGTDIVFAMHYPEGSYGTWDQTKVHFYFYEEPISNFRNISVDRLIEDWSFTIPEHTIDSVEVENSPTTTDYTMLSAFPHMHLLGKSIETYGVTSSNDTIPFARIPDWDFEWQDFYWFEYMKHIPTGTALHGKGLFDNTVSNPHNPNTPPIDVSAGLNTSDEMFLVYFHYMAYEAGDELVNVDSLTTAFLNQQVYEQDEQSFIKVFPNPFNDFTSINYYLEQAAYVSLLVYDTQGRLVKKLAKGNQYAGQQKIDWNGTNDAGAKVSSGLYYYSIMIDGVNYSGKLILR
jgi:hypothetical protein